MTNIKDGWRACSTVAMADMVPRELRCVAEGFKVDYQDENWRTRGKGNEG